MNFHCFLLRVLPFLAFAWKVFAETSPRWAIRGFINTDYRDPANPAGNVEVHCFNLNEDGHPTFVRGTYGQRGYFEGRFVSDNEAQVTWSDIGYLGKPDLYIEAGAGKLNYDQNLQFQGGFFYEAGYEAQNTTASWGDWGIIDSCGDLRGCLGITDNSITDIDIANQFCFFDPTYKHRLSSNNVRYRDWWIFGENPNTFWTTNLGYNSLTVGGPVLGAYKYAYSQDDCKSINCRKNGNVEWGVYGLDTNLQPGRNAYIISSIWYATTGPFKDQNGASLFALIATPGGKQQQLIGFFCNTKRNNDFDKFPDTGKVFTSCSFDNNPEMKPNKNAAVKLYQTYGKFQGWFNSWNKWASAVFGYGSAAPSASLSATFPAEIKVDQAQPATTDVEVEEIHELFDPKTAKFTPF